MIRVSLRLDDPSANSHRGVENGIIAALEATGLRATFAVIPYRDTSAGRLALDSQTGAHLLAAYRSGLVEIALHGHSHRRVNADGSRPSEFRGLPVERQEALLSEAIGHLSGLFGAGSVSGFVPPWNSYDEATLAALESLGFDYISAGRREPPGYAGPLAIVPRTCQFSALESAIAEAVRYSRLDPQVVAVLHHGDFRESGVEGSSLDLQVFADRLAWLKRQPDIQVMTLREAVNANRAGAPARSSKRWLRKEHLPWRLQQRLPRLCLVDAPVWRLLLT